MTTGTHRRSSDEGSGNTTIVHNGNSVSIITQSGEPGRAEVEIEKEPGRTFIYRRIGGNTTIIEPEHQRVVPRCFASLVPRLPAALIIESSARFQEKNFEYN